MQRASAEQVQTLIKSAEQVKTLIGLAEQVKTLPGGTSQKILGSARDAVLLA